MIKNHIKNAGFSLVEIIVVIVIGGIVLAAAGTALNSATQNSNRGKALHRLLADIRFAQETAVSRNTNVNFTISAASNSYSAAYTATGTYLTSPITQSYLIVQMNYGDYKGVSITSSGLGNALTFNRIGEPLIGTANLTSTVPVATLTGGKSVMINAAGYTYIQ